jgi:hypothetical protein
VLARAGWNVEADGLFGAPPITVVVGGEIHPSVSKSLGILGLGRSRVVKIPVDVQGRMIPEKISALAGPTIICAQAGNVNTGAIDPIGEICRIAHAAGAWVHVDGAFGLWAAAAPSRAHLAAGISEADSWATDAHKWLNVPYDSGLAFVRDPHALQAAMAITAEYLPTQSEFRNPSDFTPELSRRARGVDADGTCWAGITVWQGAPRCASASRQPRPTSMRAAWRGRHPSARSTSLPAPSRARSISRTPMRANSALVACGWAASLLANGSGHRGSRCSGRCEAVALEADLVDRADGRVPSAMKNGGRSCTSFAMADSMA